MKSAAAVAVQFTLMTIFAPLYLIFRRFDEALLTSRLTFALTGGIRQILLPIQNQSVSVIALAVWRPSLAPRATPGP